MRIALAFVAMLAGCEVTYSTSDATASADGLPAWAVDALLGAADDWSARGVAISVGDSGIPITVGDVGSDDVGGVYHGATGAITISPQVERELVPRCVFEHELGHAFGMQHVSDIGDLMSRISSVTSDHECPWNDRDAAELCRVGGPCAH